MDGESFHSVYIHSLLDMEIMWEEPKIMALFTDRDVRRFFEENYRLAQTKGEANFDQDKFADWLFQYRRTNNERFGGIPSAYHTKQGLQKLMEDFTKTFLLKVLSSLNPPMLQMYNQMKLMEKQNAETLEISRKNTFEYQIEQHLRFFRNEFQRKYIDNKHYIPIHGEIKQVEEAESIVREWLTRRRAARKPADGIFRAVERYYHAYKPQVYKPIDELISHWLNIDYTNLLVIVGEYGTGKTTFSQYLCHQLAGHYLEDNGNYTISIKAPRIPLYLPLREFEESIESFIRSELSSKKLQALGYDEFLHRLRKGEFILLLDGFDEMTQEIDLHKKRQNFKLINEKLLAIGPNVRAILTVRQEYFRSDQERWDVFGMDNELKIPTLHLHTFEDEQIQQFLRARVSDPENWWNQIRNINGLQDIARRPVLLQIIIDHLGTIIKRRKGNEPIVASDLYESAIQSELYRKGNEIPFSIRPSQRIEILEILAGWMYANDTLVFDLALMKEVVDLRSYFKVDMEWEFEKYLHEFLTFSFLLNEGHERFRMSHKSFRDYLAARLFKREIDTGKLHYFPMAKTTEEVNEFIREMKPGQTKLLNLILTSKHLSEETQWQGSNAANILLRLNPDALAGQDLSYTYLPEVNFIYADLRGTDLTHAILPKAVCNRSLLEATLNATEMEDGEFYPFFREATSWINAIKWRMDTWRRDSNFPILDISPLANVNGLRLLDFSTTQVVDLGFLNHMKKVQILDLRSTQVVDLAPLEKMDSLSSLSITSTHVADLTPLKEMVNLTRLYLSSTRVLDLTPLNKMVMLSNLFLSSTQVADVAPLKKMVTLTSLNLTSTQVADLTPFAQLTNLTWLYLDSTQVADLAPIKKMEKLQILSINSTEVKDLSPLFGIKRLRRLEIIDLPIHPSQITELKKHLPNCKIITEKPNS